MAIVKIPLINSAGAYGFDIELDGIVYILAFRYNYRLSLWIMDVKDENDNDIVTGIPLVTGTALLKPYRNNAGIPLGMFFIINHVNEWNDPTRYELARDAFLYYEEFA